MAEEKAKTETPVVEKTLTEKVSDISKRGFERQKAADDAYNVKLKERIASSKSKRGPSLAGRISGLQGFAR